MSDLLILLLQYTVCHKRGRHVAHWAVLSKMYYFTKLDSSRKNVSQGHDYPANKRLLYIFWKYILPWKMLFNLGSACNTSSLSLCLTSEITAVCLTLCVCTVCVLCVLCVCTVCVYWVCTCIWDPFIVRVCQFLMCMCMYFQTEEKETPPIKQNPPPLSLLSALALLSDRTTSRWEWDSSQYNISDSSILSDTPGGIMSRHAATTHTYTYTYTHTYTPQLRLTPCGEVEDQWPETGWKEHTHTETPHTHTYTHLNKHTKPTLASCIHTPK